MYGKRILLGITGGIAAYKIAYLIRALKKQEAEVKCIMTPASSAFISPLVVSTLSGNMLSDEIQEVIVLEKKLSSLNGWSNNQSITSINEKELENLDAQHPKQIFRRSPGVWISRGSGQEHLTAIRSPVLAGPGACGSFLILEDGIPIRPTGFCNVNGLFETPFEIASGEMFFFNRLFLTISSSTFDGFTFE